MNQLIFNLTSKLAIIGYGLRFVALESVTNTKF